MKALLTKEEARKLICPFISRTTLTGDGNILCMEVTCCTDACMAWRDMPLLEVRRDEHGVADLDGPRVRLLKGYCVRLTPEPPQR